MSRTAKVALTPALIICLSYGLSAAAQQANVPDPYKPILDRLQALTVQELTEWRYSEGVAHPEDPSLDDSTWRTMRVRDKWSEGSRVFRRWIELPENNHGYPIARCRVMLDLVLSSQADLRITVFNKASVVYRGDEDMQQPILLTESAQPGEKFLVAVRVNSRAAETTLLQSELRIEAPQDRIDPEFLRQEILAARPLIAAYQEGKDERQKQLDGAVAAIDFSRLEQGDAAGFENSLNKAQSQLKALDPWLKEFTIRAVGNAHIDMAWLWPWTETVEVVRNTFQSALDLMREYPDFRFTMSSARTYEWMEEKYPDLFQEIQKRAKEGRWEVIGGMWVEPDLNMPGGESLTRQILIGKRYFQQKFGVDIKIGWNPDSFGYNWQLPQIYKKSGIDYFVTQKLLWAHEFTTFPYKLFWWEAPDGSRILTYFPHDYAGGIDPVSLGKDLSIWCPSIYGLESKDGPVMMHLYGVGDHGGGPTRSMLDEAARWTKPGAVFANLKFSSASEFFKELDPKLSKLAVPTWRDELYFQYHRGVFTTQAETKKRIRSTEELLLNAEKFASLSSLLYNESYPSQEFQTAWKGLLFDDFHDIFPGSGIGVNYLDAKRNLENVSRIGNSILNRALEQISSRTDTRGPGVPVQVFNPLAWQRKEVVTVEVQLPAPAQQIEVVDSSGKTVDSQLLDIEPSTYRARFLMLADVPSMGFETYFVRAAAESRAARDPVKASADSLENEFVRVKLDPRTGCLMSLYDKVTSNELLARPDTETGGPKNAICGNLLQTFVDKPQRWDAWNIDADFEKQHWDLDSADEVRLLENGPLRSVIRVKQHFQSSTFTRNITLEKSSPRVDVKTTVDWHEQHILLKVAFPLSAHSDKATFEIPYGSVQRPTTRRTAAEQAEFEVPAVHWGDLSDDKHGFSLLNDCKYGYDAKGNVLRLSLLRSPVWPDPQADQGVHEFTYSLYPHGGGWREAKTVQVGYELNYPMLPRQVAQHEGSLTPRHSFLRVAGGDVVVTALKKAEDSDALVLRFYEWAGKESEIKIHLPAAAMLEEETDLMEHAVSGLSPVREFVSVSTRPYEIKTVRLASSETK